MKRPTAATRALAAGTMVAGFIPAQESRPHASPMAKSLPLGAQLATWKQLEVEAKLERKPTVLDNRRRRARTWYRWAAGWERKTGTFQVSHTTHRDRAQLCALHGVRNSGRQWRRLRKSLAQLERAGGHYDD